MKYLIIILLFVSCSGNERTNYEYKTNSKYTMICEIVHDGFNHITRRCENSEVVCYTAHEGNGGGIHCTPKKLIENRD